MPGGLRRTACPALQEHPQVNFSRQIGQYMFKSDGKAALVHILLVCRTGVVDWDSKGEHHARYHGQHDKHANTTTTEDVTGFMQTLRTFRDTLPTTQQALMDRILTTAARNTTEDYGLYGDT